MTVTSARERCALLDQPPRPDAQTLRLNVLQPKVSIEASRERIALRFGAILHHIAEPHHPPALWQRRAGSITVALVFLRLRATDCSVKP